MARQSSYLNDDEIQEKWPRQLPPFTGTHVRSSNRLKDYSPITPEQLIAEVKGIYAGLIMVEARCDAADTQLSLAHLQTLQKIRDHISRLEQEISRRKDTMLLHQNFKTEHERLMCLSKSKEVTKSFQKFGSRFRDYKMAWDIGANTFHHLIDGRPPSTLKEALSVVLVASALASVLDSKNETFGMWDEVIGDLDRWKVAILDRSEKELFDEITSLTWNRSLDKDGPGLNEKLDQDIKSHWESFYDLAKELIQRSRGLYGNQTDPLTWSDPANCDGHPLLQSIPDFTPPSDVKPNSANHLMGDFNNDVETPPIKQPTDPDIPRPLPPKQYTLPYATRTDPLTLAPEPQTDSENRLLLTIFLMAGSIFWAVFTFLNRACTLSLSSLRQKILIKLLQFGGFPFSGCLTSVTGMLEKLVNCE